MLRDRWTQGFGFALKGIALAWREETHFRIEVCAAFAVLLLAFLFDVSAVEWLILVLTSTFVLAVEVLNTALEQFCNMVKADLDPHVEKIKDLAAAAVLIASIGAAFIGITIFAPRVISAI